MTTDELFLDASYAIALSAPNDQNHQKALTLADQLEANLTRLITTRAVILEIGNALSKLRFRQAAVQLMASLEEDSRVEIIGITKDLFGQGLELYRARPDKEWGSPIVFHS